MESLKSINQKTRNAYNEAGSKYFELFHNELEKKTFDRKLLESFLGNFTKDSIIGDLGCGPCGHVEKFAAKKGINVVGIDISEKCIDIAKTHNPDMRFEVGDFSELRFEDNYFDGLILYYSIIDTPKIYLNNIFKELGRVLKKNGLIFLSVKEGNEEGFQDELIGIETQVYFTLFKVKEIKSLLKNNSFEIQSLEKRMPYEDEIKINRIFAVGKKV